MSKGSKIPGLLHEHTYYQSKEIKDSIKHISKEYLLSLIFSKAIKYIFLLGFSMRISKGKSET